MMQKSLILIMMLLFRGEYIFPETGKAPPLPPVLKNVTVSNSASSAFLSWTASPSPDITGYVVYRFRNNEGYAIDTLWSPASLNYNDYNTGAFQFSEAYVVAAIDNEMNISPLSNPMNTIFLNASLDTCNNGIMLSWNSFTPSGTVVQEYQLLAGSGSGELTTFQTLEPETTSFEWRDFEYYERYNIVVRAVMADFSISESNLITVSADLERPPEWIEFISIYVSGEGVISIESRYDNAAELNRFNIMRKEAEEDVWSIVGTLNSPGGSIFFVDHQASITARYIYRIDAVNKCGVPVVSTVPAGNIVLGIRSVEHIITFSWNSFTGWPGELSGYAVEYLAGGKIIRLVSLTPGDSVYIHDYRNLMYDISSGETCFYLKAIRYPDENSEYRAISNTVCIETVESVFVPTAFTPDGNGVNDHFIPVMPFTPGSYRLQVRDRTGKLVFSSNSSTEPWDGTYGGGKLPPDVYLWYLKLQTPSGKVIERTGTVALIYNYH